MKNLFSEMRKRWRESKLPFTLFFSLVPTILVALVVFQNRTVETPILAAFLILFFIFLFFTVYNTNFLLMRLRSVDNSGFILVMAFLVILFLPMTYPFAPIFHPAENVEKRELAKKPDLNIRTIFNFPGDYEKYFNDHFGYRALLIQWNSAFKANVLGESAIPTVVFGKEKWLYFKSEGIGQGPGIDDFMGQSPYTQKQIDDLHGYYSNLQVWFKARNIHLYVLLGPNKTTVYPEYLPDSILKYRNLTKFEQLWSILSNDMKKYDHVHFIYPKDILVTAKKERLTYQKTDTHWTKYGAFLAFNELLDRMSKDFTYIKPLPASAFRITPESRTQGGDLALMISKQSGWNDMDYSFNLVDPTLLKQQKVPFVICYHDSFMEAIKQFADYRFKRVDYRYHDVSRLHSKFADIEREHPDAVIVEMVERYYTLGH